jgi:hypothetical protein
MLIGLPPFLIIRFVPFCLLMETRMAFRKKSAKFLMKNFSPHSTLTGKAKIQGFFRKIHIIFITGLFAPTPNSWERSKVNPLCKKVFILILNSQENAEIKNFEKIFFYSSLISLGKVQKVNHITKILRFFYIPHPKLTGKRKNEGF